jgi:hypothetical protein
MSSNLELWNSFNCWLPKYEIDVQGEELKKMIGAVIYIECSSKTQQVNRYTWYIKTQFKRRALS